MPFFIFLFLLVFSSSLHADLTPGWSVWSSFCRLPSEHSASLSLCISQKSRCQYYAAQTCTNQQLQEGKVGIEFLDTPCPSGTQWSTDTFTCLNPNCVPGNLAYLSTPSSATNIDDFNLSLAPFNVCDGECSATAKKSYRVSDTQWEHEYEYTGDSCNGSSSPIVTVNTSSTDVLPSSTSSTTDQSDPNQTVQDVSNSEVVYNSDGSKITTDTETTTTTFSDGSSVEETTTTTTLDNTANDGGISVTSSTVTTNTDSLGNSTSSITGTYSSTDDNPEQEEGYGTGTASGNCDSPPACSDGDPQLCAILNQQWHNMCAGELVTPSSFESQLQAEGLTDPGPSQSVFDSSNTVDVNSDVQSALNDIDTTFNPGACPLTNEQVSFFSETLTIDVSHVCDFIPLLAAIIRTMAGVSACWILLSGLTGASRT